MTVISTQPQGSCMVSLWFQIDVVWDRASFTFTCANKGDDHKYISMSGPWYLFSEYGKNKGRHPQVLTISLFIFQFETWKYFCIIITISVVLKVTLSLIVDKIHHYHERKYSIRMKDITNKILYSFGAVFFQASPNPPISTPSRVFTACYWLFLITMVAAFTGNLIATMAVQKFKLPVNTFEDLANHPTVEVGMPFGSAITDFFRNAKSGTPKKLWEIKIKRHPENLLAYTDEGFTTQLERIRSRNYALIGEVVDFEMRISTLKPCDVVMGKERSLLGYYGYAAYKGFPYMDMIDNR